MMEKTGKTLSQKQLNNKWDLMKKDWKLFDRLMRLETGIGGTRSLIDASPEWWEEKIKIDKDFAKFKGANLEIFETHYAPLFRDSVATGDQAMTPLQFLNDSNPSDVQREENIEGKGDSDEISLGDDETLFPTYVGSSSSKRKKNVANKRATKSKNSSFEDCMDIVNTFPGYEEGSKEYTQALLVFIKKQHRVALMYPKTHEAKMEVLKALVKE